MIGKYEIEIYNNRIHYFLTIKRNITILQGNSATGKTELIRLIADREENGESSGITIKSEAPCTVLTTIDWEIRLDNLNKHIIFIDESASFIKTEQFAKRVRGSDNYFVIITRDDLPQLPYSIEEILGLKNVSSSSKYKSYKRIYNETYKLYNLEQDKKSIFDTVITEDTNAGYECFDLIYDNCISAGGKSKIYNTIRQNLKRHMLVIVDGAAFGSEISKVYRYIQVNNIDCVIYAPESFEYLILSAKIVDISLDMLENTYMYADSTRYMSWEEFYTSILVDLSRDSVFRYSKSKLAESYKSDNVVNRIISMLPYYIR